MGNYNLRNSKNVIENFKKYCKTLKENYDIDCEIKEIEKEIDTLFSASKKDVLWANSLLRLSEKINSVKTNGRSIQNISKLNDLLPLANETIEKDKENYANNLVKELINSSKFVKNEEDIKNIIRMISEIKNLSKTVNINNLDSVSEIESQVPVMNSAIQFNNKISQLVVSSNEPQKVYEEFLSLKDEIERQSEDLINRVNVKTLDAIILQQKVKLFESKYNNIWNEFIRIKDASKRNFDAEIVFYEKAKRINDDEEVYKQSNVYKTYQDALIQIASYIKDTARSIEFKKLDNANNPDSLKQEYENCLSNKEKYLAYFPTYAEELEKRYKKKLETLLENIRKEKERKEKAAREAEEAAARMQAIALENQRIAEEKRAAELSKIIEQIDEVLNDKEKLKSNGKKLIKLVKDNKDDLIKKDNAVSKKIELLEKKYNAIEKKTNTSSSVSVNREKIKKTIAKENNSKHSISKGSTKKHKRYIDPYERSIYIIPVVILLALIGLSLFKVLDSSFINVKSLIDCVINDTLINKAIGLGLPVLLLVINVILKLFKKYKSLVIPRILIYLSFIFRWFISGALLAYFIVMYISILITYILSIRLKVKSINSDIIVIRGIQSIGSFLLLILCFVNLQNLLFDAIFIMAILMYEVIMIRILGGGSISSLSTGLAAIAIALLTNITDKALMISLAVFVVYLVFLFIDNHRNYYRRRYMALAKLFRLVPLFVYVFLLVSVLPKFVIMADKVTNEDTVVYEMINKKGITIVGEGFENEEAKVDATGVFKIGAFAFFKEYKANDIKINNSNDLELAKYSFANTTFKSVTFDNCSGTLKINDSAFNGSNVETLVIDGYDKIEYDNEKKIADTIYLSSSVTKVSKKLFYGVSNFYYQGSKEDFAKLNITLDESVNVVYNSSCVAWGE